MSGGGGGGDSTTQTSLPAELKPLASAYTSKALNLGGQGYTPFTGTRFADLNAPQTQALGMIEQRATQGDPTMQMATGQLQKEIAGGQTNPFLDSMVERAQKNVIGQAAGASVGSGSFGNSGVQEQLVKGLGDISSQMYGQAYEGDRGRQFQALGMAPGFANQAYADAGQLLNAGQIKQNQAQQGLDFGYQQFQEQQNLPYKQLAAMAAPFGSNLGMTQTTSQSGGGK